MKISEQQKKQYQDQGFTIIPDFLDSAELEAVRLACNQSIEAVENNMRAQGIKEDRRSEEHTSELQSLMRNSYAVFCLKKKKNKQTEHTKTMKHDNIRQ